MSRMTELETLLRSWKPRHPSPGLKERLFGTSQAVETPYAGAQAAALDPVPFRISWLVPATVTILLGCVLFSQHTALVLSQTPGGSALVAAAVSNQSAAAWLPGSFDGSHNSLPVDAFECRHGSTFASNVSWSPSSGRSY